MPRNPSKSTSIHSNSDPPRSQANHEPPTPDATPAGYKASKRINLLHESTIRHKSQILDGVMVDNIADPSPKYTEMNKRITFNDPEIEKIETEGKVGDMNEQSSERHKSGGTADEEDMAYRPLRFAGECKEFAEYVAELQKTLPAREARLKLLKAQEAEGVFE